MSKLSLEIPPRRLGLALLLLLAGSVAASAAPQTARSTQPANGRLRIVVVEGEGAVNIIQQGTAVAPVVEIRDRNDQPVAGATVVFSIRNGRATFSGARALTVTTNAAGRATASGLTPMSSGALQITASAAAQGQTAAATIAQVNVMTAAQAAAAGGAGGTAGAGAGGGAGGGASGGGLSTLTTVGVIGGAAAGGTIVATQVLPSGPYVYTGPFTANQQIVWTTRALPQFSCTNSTRLEGTMTLTLESLDGSIGGPLEYSFLETNTGTTCQLGPTSGSSHNETGTFQVTGTRDHLTFTQEDTSSRPVAGGVDNETATITFQGAIQDDVMSGTFSVIERHSTPTETALGTLTINLTLR